MFEEGFFFIWKQQLTLEKPHLTFTWNWDTNTTFAEVQCTRSCEKKKEKRKE